MSKKKSATDHCFFCKKHESEVGPLIMSPASRSLIKTISIRACSQCLELCKSLAARSNKKANSPNLEINQQKSKVAEEIIEKKRLSPKEIVSHLDQVVVGQDKAKRQLAIAVSNHYKRLFCKTTNNEFNDTVVQKSNILMIGGTGTGKTLLAKTIAEIIDVPFAIADATALTQAGYCGEDVESIISALLKNCGGDVCKSQHGIIFIDEIDKIAMKGRSLNISRDVSGEGVQQSLLKILEGSIVNVPPNGGRKHPNEKFIEIDTTNILFICGGAFSGLDNIIKEKHDSLLSRTIGFNLKIEDKKTPIKSVTHDDLIAFGMIPEFMGRLPVIAQTNPLEIGDLAKILKEPRSAILKQYQKLLAYDQVELDFSDPAIFFIAELVYKFGTGARGLRSAMETILNDTLFNVDEYKGKKVLIDVDYVKQALGLVIAQ
ncbi:MAG: ATP-dependent Clp protease ATP-binding subunit ClpX [Gemmataceae bacterium]